MSEVDAALTDFDPFGGSTLADPYPQFAHFVEQQPVFWSAELGYWVVSRYEDILPIFKDPATFSSENTQAPYKPRPPEVQKILDDGEFRAYSGLSARQPPDHTRLRGFINKAFTPRRLRSNSGTPSSSSSRRICWLTLGWAM